MLLWKDVLAFTIHGNPKPEATVEKTEAEWKAQLTPEQYRITRLGGTEMPHSGAFCSSYDSGKYACVCCNAVLFDSTIKYKSGTGWPSFTQPIKLSAIRYKRDNSLGRERVEVLCNTCRAHLGHVFPDGPLPSGLRYCVNSEAITLLDEKKLNKIETATLGGGCFWCLEVLLNELIGVEKVVSGYSGGRVPGYPTYREVCSGLTGHAEVIQLTYDAQKITFKDLLKVFFTSHDPTTLNRQGADVGTQYRSVIFYHNERQKESAQRVVNVMSKYYDDPIVTEISPYTDFFKAEDYHQNYYNSNKTQPYCAAVITPKLTKFRSLHVNKLKENRDTITK